ncbi:MAG: hypothetical protein EXS16_07820 [Gemmataceae bacterium]|nr:hypothetical protein [Gemmataceae bacterium]
MNLLDEFLAIITQLGDAKIPYAICGGWALAIHGVPRFTMDIDLLVRPEDFQNVLAIAVKSGFDAAVESLSLVQIDGSRCEVRRLNKFDGNDHTVFDVILAQDSLEPIWASREIFAWQGRQLPVCSAIGLARMKRLASRPQDLVDIQSLGFDINDPAIQP